MIDQEVILAKANNIEQHIRRIREKRELSLDTFLADIDSQESILFNLQMAVQNCIDIASHIISDEGLGVAGSTNEMFFCLKKTAI